MTQAAELVRNVKPQQAYGSNQVLLAQPQTIFSTPKILTLMLDKRMAQATGNTRYRYSKIAPLEHRMADDCVSLAAITVSSTITKPIKT